MLCIGHQGPSLVHQGPPMCRIQGATHQCLGPDLVSKGTRGIVPSGWHVDLPSVETFWLGVLTLECVDWGSLLLWNWPYIFWILGDFKKKINFNSTNQNCRTLQLVPQSYSTLVYRIGRQRARGPPSSLLPSQLQKVGVRRWRSGEVVDGASPEQANFLPKSSSLGLYILCNSWLIFKPEHIV